MDLADVFCFEEYRVVQNDWTVRYQNRHYQILRKNKPLPKPKDKVLVRLRLDGTLHLVYRGTPLAYRTISVKKLRSRTVKKPATRKRKTKAEPSAASRPSNSPWGQNGTLMFAETRKKK